MSLEFHTRVAKATHNPALEMLVESFRGPLLMSLREAKEAAPEMGAVGTQEHEQFIAAIRRRDPDRRPASCGSTSAGPPTASSTSATPSGLPGPACHRPSPARPVR